MTPTQQLYIELLKKVLRNDIYREAELRPLAPSSSIRRIVLAMLHRLDLTLVRKTPYCVVQRETMYAGSPPYAHTMLGPKKIDNIQFCIEAVLRARPQSS